MADSLTIIEVATSVSGIIEAVTKVVSTLNELHKRWKHVDFTFLNLGDQLSTLSTILNKLQEWIETDMGDAHRQLVIELEALITCCRMLVTKIDFEVSELRQYNNGGLNTKRKTKSVSRNWKLEEFQIVAERQTNAFALLLALCNCKAISDQEKLLEGPSTEKIFKRVRDDTLSLYIPQDSSSLRGQWIRSLSNLSDVFGSDKDPSVSDKDLFLSTVYEQVIQTTLKSESTSSLNETLELNCKHQIDPDSVEAKRRSQLIDRQLEEDSIIFRRTAKIFFLGNSDCSQTLVKQMKIVQSHEFSPEELSRYKDIVRNNLWDIINVINCAFEKPDIEMDEILQAQAQILAQELRYKLDRDSSISAAVLEAVQGLWTSDRFVELINSREVEISDSAPYFMQHIERMTREDYIPTNQDILQSKSRLFGIHEYEFTSGSLPIRMFLGQQHNERKKWIHLFDNLTSVIFSVDLSSYNQLLVEDSTTSMIMEMMVLFDSIVNSRWFTRCSFILLFWNVATFKEKIARDPLSKYIPNYRGGNDVGKAIKYLFERFSQLNRAKLKLFCRLSDISNPTDIKFVSSAIKESILLNMLRDRGTDGLRMSK